MACLHCLALVEQLSDLKRELGRIRAAHHDQAYVLGRHLGLSRQNATALAALYRANGRVLTKEQLDEALPETADGLARTWDSLNVAIHRIRKKTSYASIDTYRNIGWAITDVGKLLCEEALEAHARAA